MCSGEAASGATRSRHIPLEASLGGPAPHLHGLAGIARSDLVRWASNTADEAT